MISPDNSRNTFREKLMSLGRNNFYSDAIIELTSRCNAKCDCCYTIDNKSIDLTFGKIKTAIDKISDVGILTLNFTGGEPFIRSDILNILQYAIKKDFWHFSILSNGTLLNNTHFSFLKTNASYFKNFQMSLFSHNPTIHDKYMGIVGSHEKILKSADKLRHFGIPVTLSFNILDFNVTDYQKTMDLMLEHSDIQQVGVTKLFDSCRSSCNHERLKSSTSEEFYIKMLKASSELLKSQKNKMHKSLKHNINTNETSLCSGIYTSIFIDSHGDLRPCPAFRKIKAGNILDKGSLIEIINHHPIYGKIKALKISDINKCNSCKFNNFCNFCIGLSHSETGSLNEPSPQYCSFASAIEKL